VSNDKDVKRLVYTLSPDACRLIDLPETKQLTRVYTLQTPYPLDPQKKSAVTVRILPVVQSADPHVRRSAFYP